MRASNSHSIGQPASPPFTAEWLYYNRAARLTSRNIGSTCLPQLWTGTAIEQLNLSMKLSSGNWSQIQRSNPTLNKRTRAAILQRAKNGQIKEQRLMASLLHHYSREFKRDGTMDSSTNSLPPQKSFISFSLIPLNHHHDHQEQTNEPNGLACHSLEIVRRWSEW